jgi:hypothetical protein
VKPQVRRAIPALVASVTLHVVLGGALLWLIAIPNRLTTLLSDFGRPVRVERVGFLALPRLPEPPREAARAGGDNRPDVNRPSAEPTARLVAPVVAPVVMPAAVPQAPAPPAAAKREGGSGDLIGGGGPTRGVRPSYNDPRLWLPTGPVVSAPMQPSTRAESLYTLLADQIKLLNDSLAIANGNQRAPGDWTINLGGKKYGIDPKYIRLGKFSIPTAVLGMLPLNVQANPIAMERARVMSGMSREIQEQALRASRDDDFRAAIRAIRARKDRERAEAAAKAETPPAPPKP